uniref:Uncharacterized protein n=1 Tax=Anguilla anguilla TaxID=7936 RepID=A0A0E9XFV0_ANGAN
MAYLFPLNDCSFERFQLQQAIYLI